MKTELSPKRVLGTAIAVLCLIGIPSSFNFPAQAQPAPIVPNTDLVSTAPDSSTIPGTLPSNIDQNSPLAQVVHLVQAGVEQSVILTYITNSSITFNLDSDQIIYLNDIGAPKEIVTAMIQRDQQLKQMGVATGVQTTQPSSTTEVAAGPPALVTQNYFYDTLSPYGEWMDVEGYGMCWRPTMVVYNAGWQPYCDNGHWVYTDCGWYWISGYSWGWATFHYGRWFHHPHHGWCWVPDTVWAPSWVTWRYDNDYCGWAPLPPHAVYREGIGFVYQGRNVSVGFDFGLDAGAFTFVRTRDFCDPHLRQHRIGSGEVTRIYNHTTIINSINVQNNTIVNIGIAPEHITAVTRTPIHPIAIREATSPAGHGARGDQLSRDGGTLIVNRPHFADNPTPGGIGNNRTMQSGAPMQNNFQPPANNGSRTQTQQTGQPQVPNVTARGLQDRNVFSVPTQIQTQRPSAPANYSTPSYDNRIFSPRRQQQLPQSEMLRASTRSSEVPVVTPIPDQRQFNAPETSHYTPPAASVERSERPAPATAPSSPSPQRSDRQDQDQDKRGH
jgi:hypothetical protein